MVQSVIPDDTYKVVLASSSSHTSRGTGRQYQRLVWVVFEGDHAGTLLFQNIPLNAPNAKWLYAKVADDPRDIEVGVQYFIEVSVDAWHGKYLNGVGKVKPYNTPPLTIRAHGKTYQRVDD